MFSTESPPANSFNRPSITDGMFLNSSAGSPPQGSWPFSQSLGTRRLKSPTRPRPARRQAPVCLCAGRAHRTAVRAARGAQAGEVQRGIVVGAVLVVARRPAGVLAVAGRRHRLLPVAPGPAARSELCEQIRGSLVAVRRQRVVGLAARELAGDHRDVLTEAARLRERPVVRQRRALGPQSARQIRSVPRGDLRALVFSATIKKT